MGESIKTMKTRTLFEFEKLFTPKSYTGFRVNARLDESAAALEAVLKQGFDHWVVMFSGGKDSTTALIVSLETILERNLPVRRVDIVYADTLVEIPPIRDFAYSFLLFLRTFEKIAPLPIFIHVLKPSMEERFWVCLLGKGYPPPHQRFRWCTKRLKIKPVEVALKSQIDPNRTVILTGIRFGESADRDRRLNYSCHRGGECGQGVWFKYSSRLKAAYLAPIVYWQECDVWDFLNYLAPEWGYPSHFLEKEVYNGRETRFGCWTCTVVRQDKAMEKITAQPKWTNLRPLMEYRERLVNLTSSRESRYCRPNGMPGRLSLKTREQLLSELLQLQEHLNKPLIAKEEVSLIRTLWSDPRYGKYEGVVR